MKHPRPIVSIVALGLLISVVAEAGVKQGDRAPELKGVEKNNGKKLELAKLRGNVVVLSFGASWCVPCKEELPALDKVAIRLVRTEKLPVRFVAINLDSEIPAGKRFVAGLGLDCIISGYDPKGRSGASYAPSGLPMVYVIDKKGIVRHLHRGYTKGDDAKLEAVVRGLL